MSDTLRYNNYESRVEIETESTYFEIIFSLEKKNLTKNHFLYALFKILNLATFTYYYYYYYYYYY